MPLDPLEEGRVTRPCNEDLTRASNETTFSNEDVLLTRLPKTFDQISNEAEKDGASYGRSAPPVEQWRGQTSQEWLRDAAWTVGEAALTAD